MRNGSAWPKRQDFKCLFQWEKPLKVGMGVPEVQANPSLSGFMPGRRVGPEPAALLQFWVIWMANPGYRISTICFSSMTVLCNSMLIIRL